MKASARYWFFGIALTLIAGEVGAILGGAAEFFYTWSAYGPYRYGWSAGLGSGLIVGGTYYYFLIRRHKAGRPLFDFSTYVGVFAGIVSSTIVHAVLSILFGLNLFYMLFGVVFGITAGAVMGLLSYIVITVCCKQQVADREPSHASA